LAALVPSVGTLSTLQIDFSLDRGAVSASVLTRVGRTRLFLKNKPGGEELTMVTGVTVKAGNSPYNVSSGETDTSDLVVNGGSMFVLSGGVADTTTFDAGGFLTIDSGGIANSTIFSGGTELVSFGGTDFDAQISGGEQNVYGTASTATVSLVRGLILFLEPPGAEFGSAQGKAPAV
jgi:autotransporter passenger strand-loop-strand repeat protein